jgi:hemolysin activation/secretion protein
MADGSRHPPIGAASSRVRTCGWIGLAILLGSGAVHAQTLPNAGSLLKQLQSGRAQALPPKAAPAFVAPPPLKSISGPTLTVKRFRFQGNHLLGDRQLAQVVRGYLHRPLSFAQLQNVAIAVAGAYRKAGWIVRAYLPQQDVTGGTVTIEVIEASFGAVRVQGNPARISAGRLEAIVDAAQRPGRPVNADALDRALLLINDLAGVSATGQLAPGSQQAQTDLVLETSSHPLLSGAVSLDDGGQRFTGTTQATVAANFNSPLRMGDLAQILYLHSQGTDFESAGYDLPIGARGLRVGADASHLSYRILTAEFAILDADGQSTTADVHASYPLIRARLGNLYVSAAAGDKWFDNRSLGATTSRYSIETGQVSLTGNRYDDLGAGGSSTVSLVFEQGLVDLGGSPNEAVDAQTEDTAGAFHKESLSFSRLQALTQRLSLYASATGQLSSKNLDSSEKLYLGGESGIRAYPTNEGGGSEGVLTHFEARVSLPAAFDLTGFLDWGEVHFNRDSAFAGAAAQNAEVLKGGGAALAWTAPLGLTLRLAIAHRIGRNPDPTSAGTDQDGTLIENRIWAQASMPF